MGSRVVAQLRNQIVRHGRQLGLQRADAEDVAHAVLLRLVSGESVGDYQSSDGWAWRVAFNGMIDLLRADRRRRARETAWFDVKAATARDPEQNTAVNQAVARLGALPEAIRNALLLCLAEGLSHQAAAEALCVPLGTVKTRVRLGVVLARRSMRGAGAR